MVIFIIFLWKRLYRGGRITYAIEVVCNILLPMEARTTMGGIMVWPYLLAHKQRIISDAAANNRMVIFHNSESTTGEFELIEGTTRSFGASLFELLERRMDSEDVVHILCHSRRSTEKISKHLERGKISYVSREENFTI